MAHPDLDALVNDLLPFAQRMLAEYGEFYPFGGSITAAGEHISVGAKGESDMPPSKELIDIMTAAFRAKCSRVGAARLASALTFELYRPGRWTRQMQCSSLLSAMAKRLMYSFPTRSFPTARLPIERYSLVSGHQSSS